MRFKLFAGLLALTLLAPFVAPPYAQDSTPRQPQQDEQDIIDDFVTTRGAAFGERPKKPANTNTSGNTQPKKALKSPAGDVAAGNKKGGGVSGFKKTTPPREKVATSAANKNAAGPGGTNAVANTNANTNAGAPDAGKQADEAPAVEASAAAPAGPIGLGYTILSVAGDGSNTVVDSARTFAAGDKIRIALETNADGFLYIFNAENDGPAPLMLYPHPALDGGANRIAAHARDFFPADLRYSFEFDDAAATEHLYVIFSRRPLADVPAGEALLAHCGGAARDDCYWKPAPEQWERLKAAAGAGRVAEKRNDDLAKAQTPPPAPSLARGIKVKKNEPAPSVVRMNASAESDVLLTKIKLVHK
ncbi:MAG TPA: DUF4384 domain-containing protein [Pyrinomonadaceae bacterium]|nr:DUF4384 domain-containing protein [Pyrinomonadaceae bacterium]